MGLDDFGLSLQVTEGLSPHWFCFASGCGRALREVFPRHFQCSGCATWRRVAPWEYEEKGLPVPTGDDEGDAEASPDDDGPVPDPDGEDLDGAGGGP